MSYEIVKNISIRKKDNKIFITSASNNVWPRIYSRWEFMSNEHFNKNDIDNKKLQLFIGIIGGGYKLSGSVNENWKYAENKFREYCKKNNISTTDIWELAYKDDGDIELLKPYYEIFKSYLEEKREGKYYLNSSLGIITRVNTKSFNYTQYNVPNEKYCNSYKKTYNDYCNISLENREKYGISIKEYCLNKESNNLNENIKNDVLLGL